MPLEAMPAEASVRVDAASTADAPTEAPSGGDRPADDRPADDLVVDERPAADVPAEVVETKCRMGCAS
jgi:hypothetical protein